MTDRLAEIKHNVRYVPLPEAEHSQITADIAWLIAEVERLRGDLADCRRVAQRMTDANVRLRARPARVKTALTQHKPECG